MKITGVTENYDNTSTVTYEWMLILKVISIDNPLLII